jgi:hypothetical protein
VVKVNNHQISRITELFITSTTLVDFPQFPDIHYLIPQVLDLRPKHTTKRHYHHIEGSEKWEIYVKYRQIVSRFLTDRTRSGGLFVDKSRYVELAKYLALFLMGNME